MESLQFSPGDYLYRQGETGGTIFELKSGSVELVDLTGNGTLLAPGQIFGESAILNGEKRMEHAIARSNCEVSVINGEDLKHLLESCPEQIQKMLKLLYRRAGNGAPVRPSLHEHGANGQAKLTISYNQDSLKTLVVEDTETAKVTMDSRLATAFERLTELLMARCDQLEDRIRHAPPVEAVSSPSGQRETAKAPQVEVVDDLPDYGPLEVLLNDDDVNDILVNGHDRIFVERRGKLVLTDIKLPDEAYALKIAHKIVQSTGRSLDVKRPLVDARLPDGSRVNVIAPPLAVDGTTISIRKFAKVPYTLESMVANNNLSESLAEFLKVAAYCRLNMIISGGTGAGKTTLLNAISQNISNEERIVTIEDAAELRLQQPHVVRLETRPVNFGFTKDEEVSMRDLVKNALRMRPDRIIVGEVRGQEAFDMLQAMNTGHEGSMSTIHANHPRDAMSRIENMLNMANLQIPTKSIRYQIASALNLVIQISRMRDGKRRITFVSEVVGMEGDIIVMQDLFNFKPEYEDENGNLMGKYVWSGIMPRFIKRVAYYGMQDLMEKALGVKIPKH